MVVVPLCLVLLALFLQRSTLGIAILGAAERADRASTLGIPVRRLQTVVWAIAGVLAYVAIFLRAGIVGLPVGYALSFAVLLRSLAALMMGRLTNLPAICASAVALGVLELGVAWDDLEIAADWGVDQPTLSDRDRANPTRADLPEDRRPHWGLRT